MTNMKEQQENKWLSTLQGVNVASSNELDKEALILRNVIIKNYNERVNYSPTDAGFNQLLKKVNDEKLIKSVNFNERLKGLSKYFGILCAGLSLGLIIGRFEMVTVSSVTRGLENSNNVQSTLNFINLSSSYPEFKVNELMILALNSELEVNIVKIEEKYQIFLKPFRKNYNKQNAIKKSLNLSNEFSGEASVIISKD